MIVLSKSHDMSGWVVGDGGRGGAPIAGLSKLVTDEDGEQRGFGALSSYVLLPTNGRTTCNPGIPPQPRPVVLMGGGGGGGGVVVLAGIG